jgi:hypothetical protein
VLSPNPFNYSTTLTFNNLDNEKYTLTIFNSQGKQVRSQAGMTSDKAIIERGNLPQGIYFFRIFSKEGFFAGDKFIID